MVDRKVDLRALLSVGVKDLALAVQMEDVLVETTVDKSEVSTAAVMVDQ